MGPGLARETASVFRSAPSFAKPASDRPVPRPPAPPVQVSRPGRLARNCAPDPKQRARRHTPTARLDAMGVLQPGHLLVILAIVLILFGAGRIPETLSQLGKGMRDFRAAAEGKDSLAAGTAAPMAPAQAVTAAPRTCASCGAAAASEARFCTRCGAALHPLN